MSNRGADVRGLIIDGVGDDAKLLCEGEPVGGVKVYEIQDQDRYFVSSSDTPSETLLSAKLDALDARLEEIWLYRFEMVFLDQPWSADVQCSLQADTVEVTCQPIWDAWTSAVSYSALRVAAIDMATEFSATAADTDDGLTIVVPLRTTHCTLREALDMVRGQLDVIFRRALKAAASRVPTTVLRVFDFPPDVASACEQYLIHFGEFLRDMGVGVVADLRHEAGSVLFSVTPNSREVALDAIRVALDVYLRLPGMELEGTAEQLEDQIAAERLVMNIYHLKAQLTSASLILRLQGATIEAQQCTIDAQKALIQAQPYGAKTNDSEPVIDGVLDIIPIEATGIRVNLPAMWRRVKSLFV
jgi:hypothetical protein